MVIEDVNFEYELVDIEHIEVEEVQNKDSEYVYDLEVEDTHAFYANNVLVHNSVYVQYSPITDHLGLYGLDAIKFIIKLNDEFLADYLEEKFEEYAHSLHCKKNIQVLEPEKISRTIALLAKKNYVMDMAWMLPDVFFDEFEKVSFTGFEVVKSSTPKFFREEMKKMIRWVIKSYKEKNLKVDLVIDKLREVKELMKIQPFDDICPSVKVNKIEQYSTISPSKGIVFFQPKVPAQVKASAYYNLLLKLNPAYMGKYKTIVSGEKVKYYKTLNNDEIPIFAYKPEEYPYEFAPEIDFDKLFERNFLTPMNRIFNIFGLSDVPKQFVTPKTFALF